MTNPTRDDALIAEVARAISRKVDSFGDTERTEQQRAELEWPRYREHAKAAIDLILARENWTPPAKPDRYVVAAREFLAAWYGKSHIDFGGQAIRGLFDDKENFQAAAAVLRRYFEPSAEVVEAAHAFKREGDFDAAGIMADFILEGDV